MNSGKLGDLLNEGIFSVKSRHNKKVSDVTQEIGEMLGYSSYMVEHWRKGRHLPDDPDKLELLFRYFMTQGRLNRQWAEKFLTEAGHPRRNELLNEFFPLSSPNNNPEKQSKPPSSPHQTQPDKRMTNKKMTADTPLKSAILAQDWQKVRALLTQPRLAKDWAKLVTLLDEKSYKSLYRAGRIEILHETLSPLPDGILAQHPYLLLAQGNILCNVGQPEQALACFDRAIAQFAENNDPLGVIDALSWKSVPQRMMGRDTEAIESAAKALKQLKEQKITDGKLWALVKRRCGTALASVGRTQDANEEMYAALNEFRKLGDQYMVGLCYHDLGVIRENQAQFEPAHHHYQKALQIWEELGNEIERVSTLIGLANVLIKKKGDFGEAKQHLDKAEAIAARIEDQYRLAFAYQAMGNSFFENDNYKKAKSFFQQAISLAQKRNIQNLEFDCRHKLAKCDLRALIKSTSTFENSFEEISKLTDKIKNPRVLAENSLLRAKMLILRRQYGNGQLFEEAIDYFTQNEITDQIIQAELWWALDFLLTENSPAASAHLQKAIDGIPDKSSHDLSKKTDKLSHDLSKEIQEAFQAGLKAFHSQPDTPDNIRNKIEKLARRSGVKL